MRKHKWQWSKNDSVEAISSQVAKGNAYAKGSTTIALSASTHQVMWEAGDSSSKRMKI